MQTNYYRCKECDFIFTDNLPTLEQEKKQYSHHNNSLENLGYVNMFEKFIEFSLQPFVDMHSCILEYGSGPEPVLSYLLKQKGYQVQIYDPIYANDESWRKKKFDAITSTEVFEHLHEPAKTIKELLEVLKNKGLLSIQTMFHPQNEEEFLKWWYRRDPTHVGFFSHKTLKKMQSIFNLELLQFDQKSVATFRKLDYSKTRT